MTFLRSAKMPTMYINTESGNMDYIHSKKDNKEAGTVNLYSTSGEADFSGELESVKGRGNFTWTDYDKKPYSIKLKEEADLLEMGKAQNWILLANAADISNLRNKIVYDFAEESGMGY